MLFESDDVEAVMTNEMQIDEILVFGLLKRVDEDEVDDWLELPVDHIRDEVDEDENDAAQFIELVQALEYLDNDMNDDNEEHQIITQADEVEVVLDGLDDIQGELLNDEIDEIENVVIYHELIHDIVDDDDEVDVIIIPIVYDKRDVDEQLIDVNDDEVMPSVVIDVHE